MEHTKHIWRAVFLLIGIAVCSITGRHFLVPKSFGLQGFYRNDSLGEYMAKPVIHGGDDSCRSCHQPIFDAKLGGKHATNRCEGCHGPLAKHVKDNAKIANAVVDKSSDICLRCHEKLVARPENFPQIDIKEHLVGNGVIAAGEPIPAESCIVCHDVHSPGVK